MALSSIGLLMELAKVLSCGICGIGMSENPAEVGTVVGMAALLLGSEVRWGVAVGFTVGLGVAVGFTVGLGVAVGFTVGLGVAVGFTVGLGVAVGFTVGLGVAVGFTVGLGVAVGFTVGLGVAVGFAVGFGVTREVGGDDGAAVMRGCSHRTVRGMRNRLVRAM